MVINKEDMRTTPNTFFRSKYMDKMENTIAEFRAKTKTPPNLAQITLGSPYSFSHIPPMKSVRNMVGIMESISIGMRVDET
jgi:hypothetical protein